MIETAVILAAGRGTRLREVSATRSKAMAPVVGRPMIKRVMDSLRDAGIRRFVVVVAPSDLELVDLFKGDETVVIRTQAEPKGSADALRVCQGDLKGDFLVSSCDSLVHAECVRALINTHQQRQSAATLSVLRVDSSESLSSRSVVKVSDGCVLELIEKPQDGQRLSDLTALPLYCLSCGIFERIARLAPSVRGELELPGAIALMIKDGLMVVATEALDRLDLTSPQDLLAINRFFLSQLDPPIVIDPSARLGADISLVPPVWIGAGVVIGAGAVIGPEVYLESDVDIAGGVKLERVVATRGASLRQDASDLVVTGVKS